jgi:DNA-binding transcriptional LysR family regulator
MRQQVAKMQQDMSIYGAMDGRKALHNEIATFVRVVRQGTLVGAARELGVPKSTISRRISRLEEHLDVHLVHRDGRNWVLADEGRELYDRVSAAVDTLDVAVQAARESMAMPRGRIRLTAPPDLGRMLLVKELAAFGKLYPDISFELELTNRYVDLVQEGFDLCVRAGPGPQTASAQNLIARTLMASKLQLAGSPSWAAQVESIEDLAQVPFVLFRSDGQGQTLRLESKRGRMHDVPVTGRFVVDDYTSMAELVATGVGLGLMPSIHLQSPPFPGAFVPILPHFTKRAGHIALAYPSRHLPRRVSLLIEYLTRVFTGQPPQSQLKVSDALVK